MALSTRMLRQLVQPRSLPIVAAGQVVTRSTLRHKSSDVAVAAEDTLAEPSMTPEEMAQLCKDHTMFTWTSQRAVKPVPIKTAKGVYMYTYDGKRLLDFNSQLMCSNIGHGNQRVIDAISQQAQELAYIWPTAATPVRARLGKKLADLFPGDINRFLFCLSGAEANENAIKMARQVTGKHKILARYRSFHGATSATLSLTGDPRRWSSEPGMPGVVHVMDPTPYNFSFGASEEEITANNLKYLEEVIMYEGAQNIAAMIIETVTGTNGVLAPPKGYLEGLSDLLARNNILLICDEVMAGFGRTGEFMAFQHGGIVPDIVTMAKGLTSAYAPLGAVGMRDHVYEHFQDNVFWGGLTYNSHPLCLAAADAAIDVLMDDGLIENARKLQPVMREEMDRLKAKHPSVKAGRCIGLFGMMDVQKNSKGEPLAPYNGSHQAMTDFNKFLFDNGVFTFMRWTHFNCTPPLIITEEQLREGFEVIDRGLEITDAAFEG